MFGAGTPSRFSFRFVASQAARVARWLAPLVAALVVALTPRDARAWLEVTVLSDDLRLQLERSGAALVEHALTLRIRGSAMRAFSLQGTDVDAAIEGEVSVTPVRDGAPPAGEVAAPVVAVVLPEGAIRLEIDDKAGLAKGTYLVRLRYRTDLLKSGALEREGASVRLRWLGPKLPNGLDAAKLTIALPASAGPKGGDRPALGLETDDAVAGSGAFLTTTRRVADHDEIELVRPHVSRGDQVAWTVKLDPRALGAVNDPRLRPPPSASVQAVVQHPSRERQVFVAVAAGLCVLFTALTAIKGRQVELHARAAHVVARPVARLPIHVRAFLVGPLVAIGVGLQLLTDPPAWGTVVLLVAMALMAHRTPLARPVARAPGRWLPISEADAWRPAPAPRDAWLDVSTRAGKLGLALAALVVGVAWYFTNEASPYHAALLAIDATLLVPLFFTGRAGDLPPSLAKGPIDTLRKAARALRRAKGLRVVPWARFAQGATDHDELRLLVMPRTPARGLNGIEIGCAFLVGEGGAIVCPEILVRVVEDSDAAARAKALAPYGRWVRGRRVGELVLSVEPRLGGWRLAASLAHAFATALTDVPKKAPASTPISAQSGEGSGDRAVNAGTPTPPFQVTDAAWSA